MYDFALGFTVAGLTVAFFVAGYVAYKELRK